VLGMFRVARTWLASRAIVVGQDPVELPSRVDQELARSLNLARCSHLCRLDEGCADLVEEVAQLHHSIIHRVCDASPGCRELVAVLFHMGSACVGEMEDSPSFGLLALDQPLILKQLERWIDRAGTGLPDTAAARGDLLNDFVAVEWLLG